MKTGQLHASLKLWDLAAAINSIIFSPQWLNIPLILQESTDPNLMIPLPPPSLLHTNFVATRENIFGFSGELNQEFRGESSTSQPSCYQLLLCSKFYRSFNPTTTVQDWPWTYSPFQLLHKTFFSAPPRSNIYPNLSTSWARQARLKNSQAATHENSPRPPGFTLEQSAWY